MLVKQNENMFDKKTAAGTVKFLIGNALFYVIPK